MSKLSKIFIVLTVVVIIIGVSLGTFFGVAIKGNDYCNKYVDSLNLQKVTYETPKFSFDEETGFFDIQKPDDEDFRILQLTDLHVGGGELSKKNDKKTFDSMLKVINFVKPHLIIVTGDVVYPFSLQTGNLNNEMVSNSVIDFFEKLAIPWTITIGNHENSAVTKLNRGELADLFCKKDLKYCLFNKNPVGENINGYGNGVINVRNSDNTINNTLILLDSNNTVSLGKYDKIHDDQVNWYKKTIRALSTPENGVTDGGVVKSLAFFHIPLEEYKIAYNLYKKNSDEVKYLYGRCDEKILCHKSSKKQPKGKFFDAILELGSTKATFCGHDHKNNFAIIYKGIQLTFGTSMVYNGLFGIAKDNTYRGGTLITLNNAGEFKSKNIFERDIK